MIINSFANAQNKAKTIPISLNKCVLFNNVAKLYLNFFFLNLFKIQENFCLIYLGVTAQFSCLNQVIIDFCLFERHFDFTFCLLPIGGRIDRSGRNAPGLLTRFFAQQHTGTKCCWANRYFQNSEINNEHA